MNDIPVVIENRSKTILAGFANPLQMAPTIFPVVVGRNIEQPKYSQNIHLGREFEERRDILTADYPVKHGIVKDYDNLEKIWGYIFDHKLQISPENHPVLLTEAPLNPEAKTDEIYQIMFEKFNIKELHIEKNPILTLLGIKKANGIVVDCGDDVTNVTPDYNGTILLKDCLSVYLGDQDVTDHLKQLLMNSHSVHFESDTVRDIKERMCHVALDFEKEMAAFQEQSFWRKQMSLKSYKNSYKLPDGQLIKIGNEKIRSTEALFQPSFLGKRYFGIHNALYDSIMKIDIEYRNTLSMNTVLTGCLTKCTGFPERMIKEVTALVPSTTKMDILVNSDNNLVWRGGSSLASSPIFKELTIKNQDYKNSRSHLSRRKNALKSFLRLT
ncbi:actin-3-like [Artemia franciscana]|uniref:actin-3-like n=1 Tax=Artemia franciscana TaxID=6661 RepID=UPI0032DBC31B